MSDNVISSTTQEFLDVYDIVNDMVLLKDGSAAIILQIGTMNFSLLAEQEQDAVIFTYGSVLNSLNYPIQINIQSQTKDATKYLRLLDEQITKASSDRKAALIKQYRDFVEGLIKERNVLQKRFYIVAPASPSEMGLIAPSSVLPGQSTFNIAAIEKSIVLEKANNILEPRRDHLTAQFNRLGLFARQLSTQEIIQNFYINYNPEAAEGQEISSSENYTTPLVRASFGGKFMQLNNIMQNQATNQSQVQTQAPAGQQTPIETLAKAPIESPVEEPAILETNQDQTNQPISQESDLAANQEAQTLNINDTGQIENLTDLAEDNQTVASIQEEQPSQEIPSQSISPELDSEDTSTQALPPVIETLEESQVFPPAQEPQVSTSTQSPQDTIDNQIPEIPTQETVLDLRLDPSLLGASEETPPQQAPSDQFMIDQTPKPTEVFAEPELTEQVEIKEEPTTSEQPELDNIPQVETAPIIEEPITPDTSNSQTNLSEPDQENTVENDVDFSEEITPMQIQDAPDEIKKPDNV